MNKSQLHNNNIITKLNCKLRDVLPYDRKRIKNKIFNLNKRIRENKPYDKMLKGIEEQIRLSTDIINTRKNSIPEKIIFPDELPVSNKREEIASAIAKNQVIIIAGSTGSGKTTQLPKICLESGRGINGYIGCTQPRRIAAMSVAERVSEELDSSLGDVVGYQIRFDAKIKPESSVKFMTDGVMLAEIPHDPLLLAYDTIIIDEAHERSLNIDFLAGYLKTLLNKRKDLKVIVSSATLDVERFSKYFNNAPVIEVEGKTYPVEVRYRPPLESDEDPDIIKMVANAVDEINAHDSMGDILVFHATEQDIRETVELLTGRMYKNTEILPLFGRLSSAEQKRVFHPDKKRRIIISTNVAETSVTIPRIRYVIDPGFARVRRFNPQSQVEHLLIESISKASADQRKGRCGRIAPGICIRLYSEEDFDKRSDYTDPEILRSSLAGVILQMKSMRLGDIDEFPFIESPANVSIKRGHDELFELCALDKNKNLTPQGRQMMRLSAEPRFARILLEGSKNGCLAECLTIVAALSIADPKERPKDKQQQADSVHNRFKNEESDFLAWLSLWKYIQEKKKESKSNNRFRKFCKKNFLSYMRCREWENVRRQLAEEMLRFKHTENTREPDYASLHQSLLAGLLCRIGTITEKNDYFGAHASRFYLFPGSGLFDKKPKWVLAAEIVRTSKLYARTVAKIDSRWIEPLAKQVCKKSYSQPRWDEKGGCVRAYEKVTLWGITIVEKRRVHYGNINPDESRKIFIEEAMANANVIRKPDFLKHNVKLETEVKELENRARRTGILIDKESLACFYDEKIPKHINTMKALEKWYYREIKKNPDFLKLTKEDIQVEEPNGLSPSRFPAKIKTSAGSMKLSYKFEPGSDDDGVTCTVPLGALAQLEEKEFSWLVPGLLREKVSELIRSLPRSKRRQFVPVPDTVDSVMEILKNNNAELVCALTRILKYELRAEIDEEDFAEAQLPAFLKMNFRIIDEKGHFLSQGRDLKTLSKTLKHSAEERFEKVPKKQWEKTGITEWDFGALPEKIDISERGTACWGFPALVDEGKSVSVRLFNSKREADVAHKSGLCRLYMLNLTTSNKGTLNSMKLKGDTEIYYHSLGGKVAELKSSIIFKAIDNIILMENTNIRDEETFLSRLNGCRNILNKFIYDITENINKTARMVKEIRPGINSLNGKISPEAFSQIKDQLGRYFFDGCVGLLSPEIFKNIERYINGLKIRLERLQTSPHKDKKKRDEFSPLWKIYCDKSSAKTLSHQAQKSLAELHYMLEEYRISLFAQELGTVIPVSEKKLEKFIAKNT
jgi:ATP-dependent helicase HrpA